MDLPDWIRHGRQRLGLTQDKLGKAVGGLSQGAVGQWESGQSKPALRHLLALAQLFKSSAAPFLGPGRAYLGELVEDEEELLMLHAFREMSAEQRSFLAAMIRGSRSGGGRDDPPALGDDRKAV